MNSQRMLREVAVYIQPLNPRILLPSLVNLLLHEDVTVDAVDSMLSKINRPNEELGVGILACYKRKEYEIIFYILKGCFQK